MEALHHVQIDRGVLCKHLENNKMQTIARSVLEKRDKDASNIDGCVCRRVQRVFISFYVHTCGIKSVKILTGGSKVA